jgi:hypothetical protein
MKKILILICMLGVHTSYADTKTFEYESASPGCFKNLEITEIYKAGKLTQLKVIRDNPNDRYVPEELFCENLKGVPYNYDNHVYLTCTLNDRAPDSEYNITLVDEAVPRDPDDHGSISTYSIEKTSEGIRADWGLKTYYYNQPIYCEYR